MNSSNPFRKPVDTAPNQYVPSNPPRAVQTTHSYPNHYSEDPPPKASTSTKKLRFSEPSRSPLQTSVRADESADFDSPLILEPHESQEDHQSIQPGPARQTSDLAGNQESDTSSDEEGIEDMAGTMFQSRSSSNMPFNPFNRTLATIEGTAGTPSREEYTAPEPAERNMPRASMDVNAFKNLLMTGKATPNNSKTGSIARPPGLTLVDNSSSTDTSTISRQSAVENMVNETPRTSYERSTSEEEDKPPVPPQRRGSKRVKPLPPAHRHGKSVNIKGPQIVSFADFEPVAEDQAPENTPSNPPSEKLNQPSSEYSRPLPPLPSERDISPNPTMLSPRRSMDSDTSEPSTQKKLPPIPPLARRSSQRTPLGSLSRGRSDTSTSRISLKEDNESLAESTTSSTKLAPPPPPARRPGGGHTSTRSQDDTTPSHLIRAQSIKSPPPVPATRRRAGSNLSQTSLPASLSMTHTSPSSTFAAPPPPPPPRRRTSSKSSIDFTPPRRTSSEIIRSSFDSERRPSVSSSMRRAPITEELQEEVDNTQAKILADMEAFQREIDALVRKGSGSGEGLRGGKS